MKTENILFLIILIACILEIAINENYYFSGGIAMLIIFWFAKQGIDKIGN